MTTGTDPDELLKGCSGDILALCGLQGLGPSQLPIGSKVQLVLLPEVRGAALLQRAAEAAIIHPYTTRHTECGSSIRLISQDDMAYPHTLTHSYTQLHFLSWALIQDT